LYWVVFVLCFGELFAWSGLDPNPPDLSLPGSQGYRPESLVLGFSFLALLGLNAKHHTC
jgi:hypothetical protein